MFDILHRVGVQAPPREVFGTLTTRDGLAGWWTGDTRGRTGSGGTIHFQFGERGFIEMKVLELVPERRVVWEVSGGPADWIGTRIIWELAPEGTGTTIRFKHQGWREVSDFMGHCSTKWGTFLLSLKALLESGKGAPFPHDLPVSIDWD